MEFVTAPESMPVLISVQLLPPSCVRKRCGRMSSRRIVFTAAYAVSVSKWPASMLKTRAHGFTEGGVTFVHVRPPFIVTWITPSSLPDHSTLRLRGDGARAVMLPNGLGVTWLAYLPTFAGTSHVCRVRSPEMRVHVMPWSVVLKTAFCA